MTVSFDTLSFAKRLTAAGEKPEVAEAHAMALKEFVMETIATKADIRDLSRSFGEEIGDVRDEIQDLRAEVGTVRTELSAEIGKVRTDLSAEISAVRAELGAEIKELRNEVNERFATKDDLLATRQDLRNEIGLLRKDMDAMGLKLTVRMGGMIAVAAGAMVTLGKVL